MRRLIRALAVGLALGIILGAQPAWAHSNICSQTQNVCYALQFSDGLAYAKITSRWCQASAVSDIRSITVQNTYPGRSSSNMRVELFAEDINPGHRFAVTTTREVNYGASTTWDFPNFGPVDKDYHMYALVTMFNGLGNPQFTWRMSPWHYPGHSPYINSTRSTFLLDNQCIVV